MANFGLLNSGAAAPLKLQDAIGTVSPTANMQAAYTLAGNQVDTQQKVQGYQDTQAGQQILQQGLKDKAFDLSTPEGWDKSLKYLQEKGAPAPFLSQMSDHATKVKTGYANWQSNIAKMEKDKLEKYEAGMSYSAQGVNALTEQYNKDMEEKGKDYADAQWAQNLPKLKQGMSQTPYATPELLKSFDNLTPEQAAHLPSVFEHKGQIIKQQKEQMQAKEAEARAKALADSPKDWKMYSGPDNKGSYRVNAALGKVEHQLEDGSWVPASLPDGARLMTGAGKGAGAGGAGAGAGVVVDFEKEPPTKSEEFQADQVLMGDKPSFGNGVAAAKKKMRVFDLAAQRAEARGMDANQVKQFQEKAKSIQIAVNNLEKQQGVIAAGEQAVLGNLDQLMELSTKVDDTGSPFFNKWVQEGKKKFLGDAPVNSFHAVIASTADELAKVLSAATGAAGITEGGRKQAEEILTKYVTREQLKDLKKNLTREMETRTKAGRDQVEKELDKIKLPDIKPTAAPAAPAASSTKVSPQDQASKDKDRVSVIQSEYNKAVSAVKAAKTDEERARALGDVRSTRNELKTLGVTVPDVGQPVAKDFNHLWK